MPSEDKNLGYWLYKALYIDYWNFYNRSRRKEFWSVILLQSLISVIFTVLHYLYFRSQNEFYIQFIFYGLFFVYAIITIVPTVTVHVRRLHDTGRTGWWHPLGISFILNIITGVLAISIVFIYGLFVLLYYKGNAPFDSSTIDTLIEIVSYVVIFFWSASILLSIIFLFFDSENRTNKWGNNPKRNIDPNEIDAIGNE